MSPHSKALSLRPVRETGKSVPLARGFEQEPRSTLGFIDPNFDEACGRNVTMFVTHVVRFAEARGHRFVVVLQLGKHVQWLDVSGIVIQNPLITRDLSDRMQRQSADLANAFRNDVSHGKELLGVFIEKQMIIAEVMPAHMPVKIFRFQVQSEHICQDCVHRA